MSNLVVKHQNRKIKKNRKHECSEASNTRGFLKQKHNKQTTKNKQINNNRHSNKQQQKIKCLRMSNNSDVLPAISKTFGFVFLFSCWYDLEGS